MTPPTAPERCPTCDKPRAGDVEASHKDDCTCAACLAVCWRDWGVMCEESPWRARAIAAEAERSEIIALVSPSSDQSLPDAVRELCEHVDELRPAAAQWAKVAPLIERLRAECGEPPFRGRVPNLIECAAAILAATEATP